MRLIYLLEELNKLGTTVIIATHNEALIERLPYPRLHLEDGILHGPPQEEQPLPPPPPTMPDSFPVTG
jgi:cell division transport system ATP-binding protein